MEDRKMKVYTSKDLENQQTRKEFKRRNTYIVNGYYLFMYRVKYSESGSIYNRVSIDCDADKISLYSHDYSLCRKNNELRIQTTSWGALNYSEMKKKMDMYQAALNTVEWFNNFNWETTDICEDYD